jgi:mRNA-degrading endonuclease RelE of RelBE toxin-antitoxin system
MYSIVYHEDVQNDLKQLGHAAIVKVLKKIEKIAQNPNIGVDLGNKANFDLSGYKKYMLKIKK